MRWVNRALEAALLVMEVSWIAAASSLLGVLLGATESPLPLPGAIVLGVLAYVTSRSLYALDLPVTMAQVTIVVLGVFAIYVVVALGAAGLPGLSWPLLLTESWQDARSPLLGAGTGLALWWSGVRLSQINAPPGTLSSSFRVGVGPVLAATMVDSYFPVNLAAGPVAFVFFGAALGGFALGHLVTVAPEESRGLARWPRTAGVIVGGILGTGLFVALVLAGAMGEAATLILRAVLAVLTPIATAFFYVLGLIAAALVRVGLFLTSFVRQDYEVREINARAMNIQDLASGEVPDQLIPDWVLQGLSWVIAVAIVAGLLYLVGRTLLRRRQREDLLDEGETREQIEAESTLGDELAGALGSMLGGLRGRRRRRASLLEGLDRSDPRSVPLAAYYALLNLAQDQGADRYQWETPFEFQAPLATRYPPDAVASLTDTFVQVRYGGLTPGEDQLARVRQAWGEVRRRAAEEERARGPVQRKRSEEGKPKKSARPAPKPGTVLQAPSTGEEAPRDSQARDPGADRLL